MMIAAIRAGKLDGKLRDIIGPEVSDETRLADGRTAAASLLDQARDEEGPPLARGTLDSLTTEAHHEQLALVLSGEAFAAGRTSPVAVRASSVRSALPVAGAAGSAQH